MKTIAFLFACLLVFQSDLSRAQTLTGFDPDTLRIGQRNVTAMVTGNNFFFTSASQSGNLLTAFVLSGNLKYQIFNHMVVSPQASVPAQDTAYITFTIPPTLPVGPVDLVVRVINPAVLGAVFVDTLFAALEVEDPESRLRGHLFRDVNMNGVRDFPDLPMANQALILLEYGIGDTTDANGMYDFGVDNGNYRISPRWGTRSWKITGEDTLQVAVANDTLSNLDFLVNQGLVSISPKVFFTGSGNNSVVIMSDTLFRTLWGQSFDLVGVSGGTLPYVNASQLVSADSMHAVLYLPAWVNPGWYHLRSSVFINIPPVYFSYYVLDSAVMIIDPPFNITGTCYYDENANGSFDPGERGVSMQRVDALNEVFYAFTDQSGYYSLPIDSGAHQIAWTQGMGSPMQVTTSPPIYSITNTGSVSNVDFGLRSTAGDYVTEFELTQGFSRCNRLSTHTITLHNISNLVSQGNLTVVKDPMQTFHSFSPPVVSVSGDSATWAYSGLLPLSSGTFRYSVINPPAGQYSNSVRLDVHDTLGDPVFSDGATYPITVVCSYDPNDKAVLPAGVDSVEHYTLFSDTLDYLIRFQNTGNDTALKVLIRDTLDASLDLNTLTVVASSHEVSIVVDSNRAATFLFDPIMLPDSNVDEPGSHGFIRYRAKVMPGLPEKTRVTNTCFIYFDLNLPVQTNTVWNSMVSVINTGLEVPVVSDDRAVFFPNPMRDRALLLFRNDAANEALLSVFNLNGQLLNKISTKSDRFELSRESLVNGLYQYIIDVPASGKRLQGRFLVE